MEQLPIEYLQALESQRNSGRMKSFNYKSGYGFIHEVAGFPNDIFVNKDQLPLEWQMSELRVDGLEVNFDLNQTNEGKAHARNVTSAVVPDAGCVVSGVVKSWNPTKGFGFFSVEGFGHDVFFSKERLPQQARQSQLDGVRAVFQLQQKPDGKYEATTVTLPDLQEVAVPTQRAPKRAFYSDDNGPQKKRMNVDTKARKPNIIDNTRNGHLMEGQQYSGVVKSFNDAKGFGFIVCAESGDDLLFRAKDIRGPGPMTARRNDEVTFVVRMSPEGKGLQATYVTMLGTQSNVFPTPEHEFRQNPVVTAPRHTGNSTLKEIKTAMAHLNSNQLSEIISYGSSLLASRVGGRGGNR
eukprot:GEMP01060686.1.p1 GENE.GEMP01060686.1~~GEMP01060686.1.p1  ORF type:complete len:352 (+),score=84.50 GEMP01060686.1:69-1124(+)